MLLLLRLNLILSVFFLLLNQGVDCLPSHTFCVGSVVPASSQKFFEAEPHGVISVACYVVTFAELSEAASLNLAQVKF